jgi:hypothetical protein
VTTPHRVKTYSAESGYVYQYSFQLQRRARRSLFTAGTEFLFEVTGDRKSHQRLGVFLRDDAIRDWARRHGRALSSAEQYAAVKMRLFRVFDTAENPNALAAAVIDKTDLETLLASLDIR